MTDFQQKLSPKQWRIYYFCIIMRGNDNLAKKEYLASKDKARFISIAQKLAQHINNLAEDKNTRIRWIWQLIQNAKDVPNQFDRCRMRIEIRENKFIFAHNGDPFRVSDLQSIVAQYSSKPQENKTHVQTTGKYGTGFITTYILSRKVRIKGLLTVKSQEEQRNQKDKKQEESDQEVELVTESTLKKTRDKKIQRKSVKSSNKKYSFNKFKEDDEENLQSQINSDVEQQNKPKNNDKFDEGSLYQRFEVFLDRQYKDRDTEFYYKLMNTQHNLIQDLGKNDPQPKWQRKQGELNTQFIYQQLDQAAFKMIEEGMACLKELFPYALLFNPKLFQIQMIDKRKGKKLRNFGIKRIEESKINNLNIFNATILEEGKQNTTFSLAYLQDEQTHSIVTMPLKIDQNNIAILQVNPKMPKIFKEFPLIGCKDTGFNFVFTSRLFYPNQSRSDLLYSQIQGRNSKKSRSNWQSLQGIFKKAQKLYKILAHVATEGRQNLLIMTLQNQFTIEQFKDKNFKAIYQQFLQEVSDIKFIEFRNQRRGYIREIIFPYGKGINKKNQEEKYSKLMNSVFSLILGQGYTLNDNQYERYYPKLIKHRKTWQGHIQYVQLKDCLKILNTIKFNQLIYKAGSEQNAFNFVERIYQFLHQNNPDFVTQGKPKLQTQPIDNYVLTNKLEFKDLRHPKLPLMKKVKVPDAYCEVAAFLNIDINQNLIYDGFTKYFEKTMEFDVGSIIDRFHKFFFNIFVNYQKNAKELIKLGRFLSTFNIESQIFQVASRLKNLSDMCTPYKLNDIQTELWMNKQMAYDFRLLLQYNTLAYINDQISENTSLKKMISLLNIKGNDKQEAIQWLNKVYLIQKIFLPLKPKFFQKFFLLGNDSNPIILYGLAMNQNFYLINNLKVFTYLINEKCYQGHYPNEDDLRFYSKMRQAYNNILRQKQSKQPVYTNKKYEYLPVLEQTILQERILHKNPVITTFKEKFLFTVKLYQQLNKSDKILYMDYLNNLIVKSKENPDLKFKLDIFEPIIDRMYYEYANETKCLKKKEERQFMFYLLKHPEEIALAKEIHESVGLREALKKIKSQQTDRNEQKQKQKSARNQFK